MTTVAPGGDLEWGRQQDPSDHPKDIFFHLTPEQRLATHNLGGGPEREGCNGRFTLLGVWYLLVTTAGQGAVRQPLAVKETVPAEGF